MIRLRSALASIYVLALLAVAASAAAQASEPNWELITAPDEGVTASSGTPPITRHLYILRNDAGINDLSSMDLRMATVFLDSDERPRRRDDCYVRLREGHADVPHL